MSTFHFKQFSVAQDRCAMKVGTDGILLGSWANADSPQRILDVGTGTGLLALMLAQRFPEAKVEGIELDEAATKQAQQNAANSPFADRVRIWQADARTFAPAWTYDLIVCNPPYFSDGPKAADNARQRARDAAHFSFQDLSKLVNRISLKPTQLALIIPESTFPGLQAEMASHGWHVNHLVAIYPNENKPPTRLLVEFSQASQETKEGRLVIQQGKSPAYTPEFQELTQDFYTIF